jgi:cyanophycin synthetase
MTLKALAKREVRQFKLNVKRLDPERLQQLDSWLYSAFKIEAHAHASHLSVTSSFLEINPTLVRIFSVVQVLFQAIALPVFSVGSFKCLHKHVGDGITYTVIINLPHLDHIEQACYVGVIQATQNIFKFCLASTLTEERLNKFYHILETEILPQLGRYVVTGKSTYPILKVADHFAIPFLHLGAGIYQLGWGANATRIDRASTGLDSVMALRISANKFWSAALLNMAGLPGPEHVLVSTVEEAIAASKRLGWPLVVKPVDADRGEGVSIGLSNVDDLKTAFTLAKKLSKNKHVLIERQVDGVCHRIFIVESKVLYAVKRWPISIFGDGISTVETLIAQENRAELKLPHWLRNKPFPQDLQAIKVLRQQGLNLTSVPKFGQRLALRGIESNASGGYDEDVTLTMHPENIAIALKAAQLIGLNVAGVDIISADITIPWYDNNAIINEVNFSPLLGGGEISRRYIAEFLARVLKPDSRIPIEVFIGGEVALNKALLRQKELSFAGSACAISSHKLTRLPSEFNHLRLELSVVARCRALLLDVNVEVIVLVIQTDECVFKALPVDRITKLTVVDEDLVSHEDSNSPVGVEEVVAYFSTLLSATPA